MIYAIHRYKSGREKLVEVNRADDLDFRDRVVNENVAHQWVLAGKEHETGLWVNDGEVRYADREVPQDGSCIRCGCAPVDGDGVCATCRDS